MTDRESNKSPFGISDGPGASIQFKGRPGALELLLHPDAPLVDILEDLKNSLGNNLHLLQSRPLRLQFGDRPIDLLQYHEIRRILGGVGIQLESIGVSPKGLADYLEGEFEMPVHLQLPAASAPRERRSRVPRDEEPPPVLQAPMIDAEIPPLEPEPVPAPPPVPAPAPVSERIRDRIRQEPVRQPSVRQAPVSTSSYVSRPVPTPAPMTAPTAMSTEPPTPPIPGLHEETSSTRLHKIMRTCRAGSFHDIDGDVVVFGDVNPGAEIRATGDIFVLGALKGLAHAGFGGNAEAIIVAYDLSPTQLRLGKHIAMAPKDENRSRTRIELEVAYVNNTNQIEVELYQGRMTPSLRNSLKSSK